MLGKILAAYLPCDIGFYRHVVGFDIDADSLEIASENADDLEVHYSTSTWIEC